MATAAPLIDLQDSIPQTTTTLEIKGVAEQIQVYYVQAKDGIIQIVGVVNNKVVLIKAKVCEVTSSACSTTAAHLEKAKIVIRAKTARIQDGYVFITTKINNQVVCITAKASEVFDVMKDKVTDVMDDLHCEAVVFCDAAKAKASRAVQPIKPYYVKVHGGIAHIIATVGNKVVLVQAQISDVSASVQVRFVESTSTARAAIEHFSTPWVTRALSLQKSVASKVDHLVVSIRNGTIHVKAAIGARVMFVQAKLSELVSAIRVQTSKCLASTKSAITDLTKHILTIVSGAYGQAHESLRLLYTRSKNGVVYIVCQVKERIVVLKIKASEIIELIRSKSMELYATSCAAIFKGCARGHAALVDGCASLQVEVLHRPVTVSAAGGALAIGVGGGAAGLVAGGGVGAGFGLVLAPFTLGLSIPVGAAVGAGAGLCIGTAAGGTAGLVTGGAVGYGAQKHKDKIDNGVYVAIAKVKEYKAMASEKTNRLRTQVMGHTGGTAFA